MCWLVPALLVAFNLILSYSVAQQVGVRRRLECGLSRPLERLALAARARQFDTSPRELRSCHLGTCR